MERLWVAMDIRVRKVDVVVQGKGCGDLLPPRFTSIGEYL